MFLCDFLRKKDSKSRTKINSSLGLIRAYVRTDGRGRLPNFLGLMDLPNFIAMDAPPAFGARGSSAITQCSDHFLTKILSKKVISVSFRKLQIKV